jgi:iron complex outermembrane receptor protein
MKKICLPAFLAACVATQANAQTAPQPVDTSALEEITVTARKRSENLQDTPISITSFSANDLEARGYLNIGGLQDAAPNLSITTSSPISGSSNSASVFIRGIGQIDFTPNTNPGVGIYLDGVYIARSVGSVLDLVDIDSVEVLKGPQGTLFGRNTIGGAIDIKTTKPSTTFGESASVSYGSYNEIDAKASVDAPISDKILTKFTFGTENYDGYVQRLNLDGSNAGHEGDKHNISGRGVVELRPNDDLTVTFSIDGSRDRDENAGEVLINTNPNSAFAGFYNQVLAPPGAINQYNNQWVAGPYTTYATGPNRSDAGVIGVGLTISYDLGPVNLKSITAYRDTESFFGRDGDSSPLPVNFTTDGYRDGAVSEEFQVSGKLFDDRLTYVGGLYYFDEIATDRNLVQFPVVYIASGGNNDNSSEALFGQATYKVTSQFDFTAGLRYTRDVTLYSPVSYIISSPLPYAAFYSPAASNLTPPTILPPATARNSSHNVSPEVNLSYHWTPDIMTYFNFSQGFKSGGFTQRVFPPLNNAPGYAPEDATVYEVGAKTTFFDRRVRINGALFHTDYNDVQITELVGVAPTTQNGGSATIDGAELEVKAIPVDKLNVSASVGYTFAHWIALAPQTSITLGDKFAFTPMWNLAGSIFYTGQLDNGWHYTPRLDASYRATQYYDAVNSYNLKQPGYGLANASLTVSPEDQNPEVFFRVENMFNQVYLTSGDSDLATAGLAEGIYGRPRTFLGGVHVAF